MDAIPHALGLNPILISPKILEIGPKIKAKLRKIIIETPKKKVNIKNDFIRFAPVPLYNSFLDIYNLSLILKKCL